jgi:hypothetical protein
VNPHKYTLEWSVGPLYMVNDQGVTVINGKTQKTPTHLLGRGEDDKEHRDLLKLLRPAFETTLREVCQEVAAMRIAGTLRPFTEGEPIGVLPRRVRIKPPTPARLRREHNQRMQDRQAEMLALRARNDADIEALLRRPAADMPTLTREAP